MQTTGITKQTIRSTLLGISYSPRTPSHYADGASSRSHHDNSLLIAAFQTFENPYWFSVHPQEWIPIQTHTQRHTVQVCALIKKTITEIAGKLLDAYSVCAALAFLAYPGSAHIDKGVLNPMPWLINYYFQYVLLTYLHPVLNGH